MRPKDAKSSAAQKNSKRSQTSSQINKKEKKKDCPKEKDCPKKKKKKIVFGKLRDVLKHEGGTNDVGSQLGSIERSA